MRDRVLIFCGLIIFVALVTYPVWHGLAAHTSTNEPDVKLPVGQKQCVAPRDYMRAAHMDFLVAWRDGKVREHRYRYTAFNGKTYDVSLTQTCLGECHGKKEQFCDRCHSYAAVSALNCWDCHNDAPRSLLSSATSVSSASSALKLFPQLVDKSQATVDTEDTEEPERATGNGQQATLGRQP